MGRRKQERNFTYVGDIVDGLIRLADRVDDGDPVNLGQNKAITMETERLINGKLKKTLPEIGEDVKVMACRMGNEIDLTIAVAMVSSKMPDKEHYKSVVEEATEKIGEFAKKFTSSSASATWGRTMSASTLSTRT
jgi:S-adenosylmethionine synthetase